MVVLRRCKVMFAKRCRCSHVNELRLSWILKRHLRQKLGGGELNTCDVLVNCIKHKQAYFDLTKTNGPSCSNSITATWTCSKCGGLRTGRKDQMELAKLRAGLC